MSSDLRCSALRHHRIEHELLWCDDLPEWSWRPLQVPPFRHKFVTSHAVHPDGRTIFVSVKVEGRDKGNTFTFDTGVDDAIWACHRGWQLPFKGPAHYDRKLDAWVGLAGYQATAVLELYLFYLSYTIQTVYWIQFRCVLLYPYILTRNPY
jgi:hypothetical protein